MEINPKRVLGFFGGNTVDLSILRAQIRDFGGGGASGVMGSTEVTKGSGGASCVSVGREPRWRGCQTWARRKEPERSKEQGEKWEGEIEEGCKVSEAMCAMDI